MRSQRRLVVPREMCDKLGIDEGSSLMLSTYPSNSEKPTKILLEVIGA